MKSLNNEPEQTIMGRTPKEHNERASFWRKVGAAYLVAAMAILTIVVLS